MQGGGYTQTMRVFKFCFVSSRKGLISSAHQIRYEYMYIPLLLLEREAGSWLFLISVSSERRLQYPDLSRGTLNINDDDDGFHLFNVQPLQ